MDIELHRELGELIEDVTTSGNASLDDAKCKSIKGICKKSDLYVKVAFTLLMDLIERCHAQIRHSCLLLIDQLFCRSHAFRLLLVDELHKIMSLCVGTEATVPLPKPKAVAEAMQRQAITFFSEWQRKYGDHYRKLSLAYSYLQQVKQVDFANLEAQNNEERLRAEIAAQRKQVILKRKLEAVTQQMDDMLSDMERCLKEMESCFELLLPSVADFTPRLVEPVKPPAASLSSVPLSSSATVDGEVTEPSAAKDVRKEHEFSRTATSDASRRSDRTRSVCSVSSSTSGSAPVGERKARLSRVLSGSSTDYEADNVEEWEEDEDEDKCAGWGHEPLQQQGITSNYSLLLDARSLTVAGSSVERGYCIVESDDNSDLLTTLADNHRLIQRRFLPASAAWLAVLTKNAAEEGERLRLVIDKRRLLTACIEKYSELNITWKRAKSSNIPAAESSDEEEDDFVDVPAKEGLEDFAVPDMELDQAIRVSRLSAQAKAKAASSLSRDQTSGKSSSWSLASVCSSQPAVDPTTIAAQLTTAPCEVESATADPQHHEAVAEEARARDDQENPGLLAVAPKIRFDTDIMGWGEERKEPPSVVKLDSLHRFWNSSENESEFVNKELWESANRRSILFTGKFEPVKWSCRVPLPSGKLCPRKDRVKCPFHGAIIARDELGRPVENSEPADNADLAATDQAGKKRTAASAAPATLAVPPQPTWQELEADVAAAVGLPDLSVRKRKRKEKDKETSSLVDLDACVSTPKSRIGKRIFKKGSIKRVAAALDSVEYKRGEDRFGNQWNYTFRE